MSKTFLLDNNIAYFADSLILLERYDLMSNLNGRIFFYLLQIENNILITNISFTGNNLTKYLAINSEIKK